MQGQQRMVSGTAYRRYERSPVSCEVDGEVVTGNYWVAGMILVVSTHLGGASRQLANREPEDLAKALLRDLVVARREGGVAAAPGR